MADTVIIYNPQSGGGSHADDVEDRADLSGYAVERSEHAGEAVTLTQEAIEAGYSTIVAGGGDGTVNEVVQGIDRADAFDDVTFGILPLGTGNNFAKQIGITDLETAFIALDDGVRRTIDIGMATDRPFVNSCVAGLTAESVSGTSGALKSRIGGLAYVLTTLRTVTDFEPLQLTIDNEMSDGDTPTWSGEALCVVVGNGRQFAADGTTQANMEDGLFEVAIVTDVPAIDLMSDAVLERLFGQDSPHIDRFQAASVDIRGHSSDPIRFSVDGETIEQRDLVLTVRPNRLLSSSGGIRPLSDGHVRRRSRERPGDGKSPAEKTMFTVDLHAHTRFFHGFQAEPTPYDPIGARLLALWGRRAGLDGIALTNHDYYRPFDSATGGPQFIPGIEVTTTAGHLLVVGPDPPRRTIPGERTPEVVSQAHRNGCAAIIAHPYRRSRVRERRGVRRRRNKREASRQRRACPSTRRIA